MVSVLEKLTRAQCLIIGFGGLTNSEQVVFGLISSTFETAFLASSTFVR